VFFVLVVGVGVLRASSVGGCVLGFVFGLGCGFGFVWLLLWLWKRFFNMVVACGLLVVAMKAQKTQKTR
jgi:hypothetical protein